MADDQQLMDAGAEAQEDLNCGYENDSQEPYQQEAPLSASESQSSSISASNIETENESTPPSPVRPMTKDVDDDEVAQDGIEKTQKATQSHTDVATGYESDQGGYSPDDFETHLSDTYALMEPEKSAAWKDSSSMAPNQENEENSKRFRGHTSAPKHTTIQTANTPPITKQHLNGSSGLLIPPQNVSSIPLPAPPAPSLTENSFEQEADLQQFQIQEEKRRRKRAQREQRHEGEQRQHEEEWLRSVILKEAFKLEKVKRDTTIYIYESKDKNSGDRGFRAALIPPAATGKKHPYVKGRLRKKRYDALKELEYEVHMLSKAHKRAHEAETTMRKPLEVLAWETTGKRQKPAKKKTRLMNTLR